MSEHVGDEKKKATPGGEGKDTHDTHARPKKRAQPVVDVTGEPIDTRGIIACPY